MDQRIFGIGISRTGTTSLARALDTLGIETIHCPTTLIDLHRHRAATDITVAVRFKFLDVAYPGSKFIYTVREIESWLTSCERHWRSRVGNPDQAFNVPGMECEWRLFGGWQFDRDRWEDAYLRHDAEVRSYFKGRPEDLLVFDVASGDNWEQLMPFLGIEKIPFPHCNHSDQ